MERVKVRKQLAGDLGIPDASFLWGEREELVRLWADWLRRDKSAVVGTLRFETRVRAEAAEQLFDQWLRRVKMRNRHQLEWRGGPGWRMLAHIRYFHVLIKGLEPVNLVRAMALWERIAGRATLHPIDPEWIGLPAEQPQDEY